MPKNDDACALAAACACAFPTPEAADGLGSVDEEGISGKLPKNDDAFALAAACACFPFSTPPAADELSAAEEGMSGLLPKKDDAFALAAACAPAAGELSADEEGISGKLPADVVGAGRLAKTADAEPLMLLKFILRARRARHHLRPQVLPFFLSILFLGSTLLFYDLFYYSVDAGDAERTASPSRAQR